jgi:hypothetical protein
MINDLISIINHHLLVLAPLFISGHFREHPFLSHWKRKPPLPGLLLLAAGTVGYRLAFAVTLGGDPD